MKEFRGLAVVEGNRVIQEVILKVVLVDAQGGTFSRGVVFVQSQFNWKKNKTKVQDSVIARSLNTHLCQYKYTEGVWLPVSMAGRRLQYFYLPEQDSQPVAHLLLNWYPLLLGMGRYQKSVHLEGTNAEPYRFWDSLC